MSYLDLIFDVVKEDEELEILMDKSVERYLDSNNKNTK